MSLWKFALCIFALFAVVAFMLLIGVGAVGCQSKKEEKRKAVPAWTEPTPIPTPTPPAPHVDLKRLIVGIQEERWDRAEIRPEKKHFLDGIADAINRGRSRYEAVAKATGVPWDVVGAIHNMECGLSFRQHLFNGDPLTARTRQVPAGQPKGNPPFQWEYSAIASLQFDDLDKNDWSKIEPTLAAIERYNGTGYQRYHPKTPTPYLWSWTTVYTRGKYIADGKWSETAISQQCGVVPILKAFRKD